MIKPVAHADTRAGVDLSGKAALVTGGSTWIGRGIAARLAESGASVMLADADLEAADRAAAALRATGCRVEVVQANACEEGAAGKLIRATKRAFSRIDLLVLTAGAPQGDAERVGEMAHLSRAVARELIDAGTAGKIIVIFRDDELAADEKPQQSTASRAAVDVFLANRAGVKVTLSQDPFGNIIEITSNLLEQI